MRRTASRDSCWNACHWGRAALNTHQESKCHIPTTIVSTWLPRVGVCLEKAKERLVLTHLGYSGRLSAIVLHHPTVRRLVGDSSQRQPCTFNQGSCRSSLAELRCSGIHCTILLTNRMNCFLSSGSRVDSVSSRVLDGGSSIPGSKFPEMDTELSTCSCQ